MTDGRRTWVYVALVGGGIVTLVAIRATGVGYRGGAVGNLLGDGRVRINPIVVEIALLLAVLAVGYLGGRSRRDGRSEEKLLDESEDDVELSDREHVCQLLESNGGSMRQADIVRHFAWSKAKISRLLTELEREGKVWKVQLGRENRIYLDGYEPAVCRPSFESLEDE